MVFPKQEYWSGLPFPPPGDRPDPGIEHVCPALLADSLPLSQQGSPDNIMVIIVFMLLLLSVLKGSSSSPQADFSLSSAQKRLAVRPRPPGWRSVEPSWVPSLAPPSQCLGFCSQQHEFPPLLLCLWRNALFLLWRKGVDLGSASLGPLFGHLPAHPGFQWVSAKLCPFHLPRDPAQVV